MPKRRPSPTPPAVPTDLWESLYNEADRFWFEAPFDDLFNSDRFVLTDPETSTPYIVTVLGNAGEQFGLHLYAGGIGAAFCARLLPEDYIPHSDYLTAYLRLRVIKLGIDEPDYLDKHDRAVRRSIGYRNPRILGGRYHNFRSLVPGHAEWHLDTTEARLLHLGLQLSRHVATLTKLPNRHPLLGRELPNSKIPVFTPADTSADGTVTRWQETGTADLHDHASFGLPDAIPLVPDDATEFLTPAPEATEPLAFFPVDPERVWEITYRAAPQIINDRDRPYHPWIAILIEANTGLVLGLEVLIPNDDDPIPAIQSLFLAAASQTRSLPSVLATDSPEAVRALHHVLTPLEERGLERILTYQLPAADHIIPDIFNR